MAFNIPLHHHHVGIFVSDLDRSINWYNDVFGFELVARTIVPLPTGMQDMCFMKHGDMYLELYDKRSLKPFSMDTYNGELGTKHLCFWVEDEDFEPLVKHLQEKNVPIIVNTRHPEEVCGKPGGNGVLYIADPDGILIEIVDKFFPEIHKKP